MKVTVEVDCTPAEAREFIGLPDLRPAQNAVAKKLEEQVTARLDTLSPDAVLQNWFNPKSSIPDLFAKILTGAAKQTEGDKMECPRP